MPTPVKVPYVNLAGQHRAMKRELLDAAARVIDSGQFILGDAVVEFEKLFADLCGVKHAIGVGNGTDALVLALKSLGIGENPSDEVITAPNSFVASASAIVLAGAKPVFVDVGDDYNLDPTKIEQAVTPRTRAILPVHLTGRVAQMEAILEIAKRRKLFVIEDAAQAVRAEYRGKRAGSFGHAGCFSLHPLKTLNACGDGGVITTKDDALADRLRIMRNLGLKTREDCVVWSGNSRLDSLHASMLLVKLKYLDAWTDARRANAKKYRAALEGVKQISMPSEHADERPVYHTFVIQADRRDELKKFLLDNGVESSIHYPVPIHLQTAALPMKLQRGSFPNTESMAGRILSLPVYPELTDDQIRLVSSLIRKFYGV